MKTPRHTEAVRRKRKSARRVYRRNRILATRAEDRGLVVSLRDVEVDAASSSDPAIKPVVKKRSRGWRRFLLFSMLAALGGAAYYEMQTSYLQARYLTEFASGMRYHVEPGAAQPDEVKHPERGPFDVRMGYSALPTYLTSLTDKGYDITHQVRWSEDMLLAHKWGLFPPYREKSRVGLIIKDHQDMTIYGERYPRSTYAKFDDISSLIVETLLFIENRELLDNRHPQRNPAVEWDRMARVTANLALNMIRKDEEKLAGGSTLATQIEKYRHSPDGMTATPLDKIKQMASASVRAYLDGGDTYEARRRIVLDYVNTVPLAARGAYGEVHGIGDGLLIWYGSDLHQVEELLRKDLTGASGDLTEQALAYKQVLSLFLAQRRPSYYLGGSEPRRLGDLADVYLELLADAGVITPQLRDAALNVSLKYGPSFSERGSAPFTSDKAVNVTRTRLATMLGLDSLYDLDRLDLEVHTTFDQTMQQIATATLRRLEAPAVAREAGLYGDKLLRENNDLSKIVYSLTVMERTPDANLVRVQADNFEQPLDVNEGVKLDLGSTAKLRTLVSYLNIIAELHRKYEGKTVSELAKVPVEANNVLERWAIDYLQTATQRDLPAMLAAAMERGYSANPQERFFTGGGVHTFGNFNNDDNHKILTVREAFRESVNLPFVRMMRDIVRYHMLNVPGSTAKLLEDVNDERRGAYLARFADQEGSSFMQRFYRKYKGKTSKEVMALLFGSTRLTPQRLAMLYNATAVTPTFAEYQTFLRDTLPESTVSERDAAAIFAKYTPANYNLPDQGYIARIHPLEMWTAAYLIRNPLAGASEVLAASTEQRQEVYSWLRKTRHKNAQDSRIRQLLEVEAFLEIHKEWKRLGYPFDNLVPSYATSIGSSADRPAALAELMGILVNDGVRLPTVRIDGLHFAESTPYEAVLKRGLEKPEQVMEPAVAREVRTALRDVVANGTAKRLKQPFIDENGEVIPVGGKTGTGDHRREIYGRGGVLRESTVMNRTATFVFFIGDRYFGTLTAFVPGSQAKNYKFTSGLPVQIMKNLAPALEPYLFPDPWKRSWESESF